MKYYALAALVIGTLLLALFGLAQLLEVPLLSEESPELGGAGVGAGGASFALLAGDVVLPVPSSALMILNGSLFGPAGGTMLSLAGSEAAALLGFAIGRRGGPVLARFASPAAREQVTQMMARRGALAIVVTRPVPVIAETATILAGAAGMPFAPFAIAAALGSLPPSLAYALAGAYSARFDATVAVLAGVLLLAVGYWVFARRRRRLAVTADG